MIRVECSVAFHSFQMPTQSTDEPVLKASTLIETEKKETTILYGDGVRDLRMGHDDNTMRSRAADKKIKNVSETTVGDLLAFPTTLHVHTPARSHQTAVFFVFIFFLLTGFEFQMTHIALVRHRGYKKEGGLETKIARASSATDRDREKIKSGHSRPKFIG